MDAATQIAPGADIDLDRLLTNTRNGQWSVDDLDWSTPLDDAASVTDEQRFDTALLLHYTAGFERQAARIFDLCSHYVDDPVAKEIYKLFYIDEIRHADAEVRLAERLGYRLSDLPAALGDAFAHYETVWDTDAPLMYEFASVEILLFELSLDSITVPLVRSILPDALTSEVFRRIDIDEARHLAMDYWLLERRGKQAHAEQARRLAGGPSEQRREERARRAKHMAFLAKYKDALEAIRLVAADLAPCHRTSILGGTNHERLWNRVADVPKRAPHAQYLPEYRIALANHKTLATGHAQNSDS